MNQFIAKLRFDELQLCRYDFRKLAVDTRRAAEVAASNADSPAGRACLRIPPHQTLARGGEQQHRRDSMFIYCGFLRHNKNRTELFRMDTLCTSYAVVSYLVLLLRSPSDNVQHELQD